MRIVPFVISFFLLTWNCAHASKDSNASQKESLPLYVGSNAAHQKIPAFPHVTNLSVRLLQDISLTNDMEWTFYGGSKKPSLEEQIRRQGQEVVKLVYSRLGFSINGIGLRSSEWTDEGWFITRFRADSLLRHTNRLTIWIPRQFGDSKLFLDDSLLDTFTFHSHLTRRNILAFIRLDSGVHEIAVHFQDPDLVTASQKFGFFSSFTGFLMALGTEEVVLSLIAEETNVERRFYAVSIALLLLVVLHLLFFLFSPSEKVHLFYAIQTICLTQFYLPDSTISEIFGDVRIVWGIENLLKNSLRSLILPALVAMLTSLFYPQSLSKRHKILLGCLFGVVFIAILIQVAYPVITSTKAPQGLDLASIIVPSFLCLIETVRLLGVGIRQNRNVLWLASGGMFLLGAAFLALGRIATTGSTSVRFGLPFIVAGVGFQIGMSLFLAWQSAQTKRKLIRSLEEVQILSAQMIEQERKAAVLQLQKERERFRAESLAREAAFTALKMQINPHFLFNALASIRTLSRIQPETAQEAISQLSSLFRYALQSAKQETVTLREELRIVRDYLALERLRFEDRLQSRFSIPSELETMPIPPMTLQILVENAVKHGIENERNGGNISIDAALEDSFVRITIRNTGKLREHSEGNRIGLHNARERLRLIFGASADIILQEDSEADEHSVCAEVRYNPSLLSSSTTI